MVSVIAQDIADAVGGATATSQQLLQECEIATAGRRRAGNRVEHLAVLQRVVRTLRNDAVLVEVDGEDLLVDEALLHKGDRAGALLRDIVEDFAVEGRRGRRRAEREKDLFAAGTDRHQVQRCLINDITVVEDLGGLAGGEANGDGKSKCGRAQELPVRLENPDIHANVSHDCRWHLTEPDRFCA